MNGLYNGPNKLERKGRLPAGLFVFGVREMKKLICLLVGILAAAPAFAEVDIPCYVSRLTADAQGTLWFDCGDSVARLNANGTTDLFPVGPSGVYTAAFDSDGTLWLGGLGGGLYRMSNGSVQQVTFANADVFPTAIAADRAGNIFVQGYDGNGARAIFRVTGGALTGSWPIPSGYSGLFDFVIGPDGALWFTELGPSSIGRMTMTGVFSSIPIPRSSAQHIVAGNDGNLWANSLDHNTLFRITPAGAVTALAIPASALAASGNRVWFTSADGYGWIELGSGNVQTVSRPPGWLRPAIVALPTGDVWFVEDPLPPSPPPPADGVAPQTTGTSPRLVHVAANGIAVNVPLFSPVGLALVMTALLAIGMLRTWR